MKHFLLFFWVIVTCTQKIIPGRDAEPVAGREELRAQFPGGESAWAHFVEKNFDGIRLRDARPDSFQEFTDSQVVRFHNNKKGGVENPECFHRIQGGHQRFIEKIACLAAGNTGQWPG